MMFILKKIIGRCFFPLSVVIGLLLVGVFLKKKSRTVLLTGVVLLYLFSFAPFSYLILRPLESPHAPISTSNLNKEVRWVVVLGGGSREGSTLTPEDRLSDASLKRLMEGIRLSRLLSESRLVLSGGDYRGTSPDAMIMHRIALDQGMLRERMILETISRDTGDQAQYLKDRLGQDSFYLVTSASHMTRAVRMFKRLGTHPIAAPTDFRTVDGSFQILDLFPQAGALANTERAFYEYLGLLWGWIR
ncbi:MAG: hypothetical protein A2170_17915 [Deltaproteobacteria bacterium RBG_13_53_10]|nr:MAG: hypothetical protein A2170_17915 [Deltaproteobacteria bacterium RBG_13_53_10]